MKALPDRTDVPDRSPPHSLEAEEQVLACCLIDGGITLARAKEAGLVPDCFYEAKNRLIFQSLLAGADASLESLVINLQETRQLEAAGGMPYLMQVAKVVETTTFARRAIAIVREKSVLRALISAATRLVEESYNGADVPELLALAESTIHPITQAALAPPKAEAVRKLEERRISLAKPQAEPVTRLFLAGKPVATPGNLMTLISKAKTGKTAAIGGAVAAIVAAAGKVTDYDTLGFSASNPDGQALILIDTEQSPYDAYLCYQRSLARVSPNPQTTPTEPPWVCPYCLTGYSVPELKAALLVSIEQAKAKHNGVFTIILDGVADFVASVNDEAECNDIVTWLRAIAVLNDCPIICVIHSNEAKKGGDDGRGHIGKQLMRKAESNLLLTKVGEVTIITSEKQRKAPITEEDGVAFRWSNEERRHVSCGTPIGSRRADKIAELKDLAREVFQAAPILKWSELLNAIMTARTLSRNTADRRIKEMRQLGVIETTFSGTYQMVA